MRSAMRPSTGTSPTSTISSPAVMNTPIATGQARPGVDATSSAAPGTDQATTMGIRVRSDSTMLPSPIPTHSAVTPEAV